MSSQSTSQFAKRVKSFSKSLGLILFDAALSGLTMLGAVRWRYDFLNKPIEGDIDHKAAWIAFLSAFLVWGLMRQDRAMWRFPSLFDFKKLLLGVFIVAFLVPLILFFFFDRALHFPRSAPLIASAFFFAMIVLSRLLTMMVMNGDFRALVRSPSGTGQKALLIGPAPELYNYLRDRSRRSEGVGFNPVGLITTSDNYKGRSIRSVPVLGGMADLKRIYTDIAQRSGALQLISVDQKPARSQMAALLKIAAELNAPLARNTADMGDKISAFEAADLIGRDIQSLDIKPVKELIAGKRVLVTGAGGSIGSELVEQIIPLGPQRLIMVDQSEYNIFQLEHRMRAIDPEGSLTERVSYIADVTHQPRVKEIFKTERPDIVLHAAAMKHVPLGEVNPLETLRTNVTGTKIILEACKAFKVSNFILISTDKAVNPANIMGASKRIVEMLMLSFQSQAPKLQAAAVRFGNVLASRGSVVNLFEEQIAAGGPVTVTHPDVNRYFMMIEEASALVLQAAALAAQEDKSAHGDIYVLEMGEPVNISALARQLIRLRGKKPGIDIAVEYTGLRPGEKLTETLTHADEDLTPTPIAGVLRFKGDTPQSSKTLSHVDALIAAINKRDKKAVRKALKALLPDYKPNGALED